MKKIVYMLSLSVALFASCDFDLDDEGKEKEKNTETGNYEYVDLGLPSGVKWATQNVGANTATELGTFVAWGEITPITDYDWETYKWGNGDEDALTKYCTDASAGKVDGKTTLEATDDIATQLWGSDWRMPTFEEVKELYDKCTWTWVPSYAGVDAKGYVVKGTNGNSIFLPAVSREERQAEGAYWSSSLRTEEGYNKSAYALLFAENEGVKLKSQYRINRFCVRAVHK